MRIIEHTSQRVSFEYTINQVRESQEANKFGQDLRQKGYEFKESRPVTNGSGEINYMIHRAVYEKN